ncbi:MAG: hypothetical protein PWQ12_147 [Clostridiales bacterium]|jgi:hypothetical protein|nr:hypothetical protein [Clostridiales bacterium]
MNAKKKTFSVLAICLVLVLGAGLAYAAERVKDYENEKQRMATQIDTLEASVDSLTDALEDANATIDAQTPTVEAYWEIADHIDLESFDVGQLESAKNISEETPLDYESALALVKYSDLYDIPYSLVLSIIEMESNFQSDLVGSNQDRGYMQLIPNTERYLATTFGEELGLTYDPERIFEPEYNLALGIKYLDILSDNYGDDYNRILSEYNRGPGNLAKYYAENQTYVTSYSKKVLSVEKKYVALNN